MKHSCTFCTEEAIVSVPHRGLRLCRYHFINYVETEVENVIARYSMLEDVRKLLVAVSGGKDSVALLHILSKICERKKIDIIAVTIDLGIEGYSDECVRVARELCHMLGIRHVILRVSDHGFTIDDVKELEHRLRRPVCAVCGLVKRYLLNKVALQERCDAIATGHNLIDVAQYLVINFLSGNLEAMQKLLPVTPGEEGVLVRRIRPLYFIHEKETKLYVELLGLPVVQRVCPYSERQTRHRRKPPFQEYLRAMLLDLDDRYPGTLFHFVENFVRKVAPVLRIESLKEYTKCKICGLPTSRSDGICAFCHIAGLIRELKSGRRN